MALNMGLKITAEGVESQNRPYSCETSVAMKGKGFSIANRCRRNMEQYLQGKHQSEMVEASKDALIDALSNS
jgi:hypothetical protein